MPYWRGYSLEYGEDTVDYSLQLKRCETLKHHVQVEDTGIAPEVFEGVFDEPDLPEGWCMQIKFAHAASCVDPSIRRLFLPPPTRLCF